MREKFPPITLSEFNSREKEFRGNLAAVNLMSPRSPDWNIFHVEDIAHDDRWLADRDDDLPHSSIYATNSIGNYLDHEETLFLLYGARQMLQLLPYIRQRYKCDGPTAFTRAGACTQLALLPHDPPTFNNPVQTFHVNFMLKIYARATIHLLATSRDITIVHYCDGVQASHYKMRWDIFDQSDYIQREIVRRITQLNG